MALFSLIIMSYFYFFIFPIFYILIKFLDKLKEQKKF